MPPSQKAFPAEVTEYADGEEAQCVDILVECSDVKGQFVEISVPLQTGVDASVYMTFKLSDLIQAAMAFQKTA